MKPLKTTQKTTEANLKQIKSVFESNQALSYKIFDHMPIGICITNENGYYTDVNSSYCDMYGFSRSELIGYSFTKVVPDANVAELEKLHSDFLEKKFELQGRWTVKDKKGDYFDIITNAAFLYNEELNKKSKMTLVVKASELETTLEKLQTTIEILEQKLQAQDAAGRLAEHDMRNRIGAMVSIADILSKTEMDETQLKWVRRIKNIGHDTLRLLSSAKDYVKMERGEYTPNLSQFDIISLIASETSHFKDLIKERACEITLHFNEEEVDPGTDALLIEGDEFYLKHLFQNLLGNAIEATPKGETVAIAISTRSDIQIQIHNKGMIPKEIQSTFFEKYTTSGKDMGTGLGTYIAKMITEVHGGTISFISSKAEGTTLRVTFPSTLYLTS